MKRKKPARRNPVARSLRTLRQQKIQSAKAYRRRAKHEKARPENLDRDGLSFLRFRVAKPERADPVRERGFAQK